MNQKYKVKKRIYTHIHFFLSFQFTLICSVRGISRALHQLSPLYPDVHPEPHLPISYMNEWMQYFPSCFPHFQSSYLFSYSIHSPQCKWLGKKTFLPRHLKLFTFMLWLRLPTRSFTYHFCPHIRILSILKSSSQISAFHWNHFQCPCFTWLPSSFRLHGSLFLAYVI